jgi:hypothetical protein
MAAKETWVLGIYISNRLEKVSNVQEVLTKFGCSIRTRLGLHDTEGDNPSKAGLMILELYGDPSEFTKLENELLQVDGLEVKKMVFKA